MNEGFAYIDILFFAMVAAFIALRLRSVLGRRTGNERRGGILGRSSAKSNNDNVVALPDREQSEDDDAVIADVSDGSVKNGLTQIRLNDPGFELHHFLAGARAAFEMIVEAFAAGNKDALRPLLADDVYFGFASAIDEREQAGNSLDTELVSITSAEIAGAEMIGSRARVTVRIASDQINVTRDNSGEVVEGDPAHTAEVIDVWSFERDTKRDDPNWELVETATG
jgi:predicted lipid-binding transport protein (Tim44 family)